MAFGGGLALKSLSWFLRIIEFCCAAIIIGIFSYFLATLSNHNLHIATYIRAVEGISGAAVVYTLVALLFVCCLGGIAVFSLIGMLLDLAFCGAFIYVAWANRHGADSCSGNVRTPFGDGNTNTNNQVNSGSGGFTRLPSLHTACELQKACFAVAIVGAVFFFLSIFVEYGLIRHRKKERAFGPSPNNGYTAGSPKRKFWQRKAKRTTFAEKNPDTLPTHTTPADIRASYGTDTTAVGAEPPINKYGTTAGYGNQPLPQHGVTNGYSTTTTTMTSGHGGVANDGYGRTNYQAYNPNTNTTGTF